MRVTECLWWLFAFIVLPVIFLKVLLDDVYRRLGI